MSRPVDAMLSPRTARAATAKTMAVASEPRSPVAASLVPIEELSLTPAAMIMSTAPAPGARDRASVQDTIACSERAQPPSPQQQAKPAQETPQTRPPQPTRPAPRPHSAFTPTGHAGTLPPGSGALWSGLLLPGLASSACDPPSATKTAGWATEPARDNPFDELSDLSDDLCDRDDPFQ